jgi:hypothetical protein
MRMEAVSSSEMCNIPEDSHLQGNNIK